MTTPTTRVTIDLEGRSYPIVIGAGLLDQPDTFASLPGGSAAVIITNETVAPLFADRLARALQGKFTSTHLVTLPDGEAYKDWATLNTIFDALLGAACDRSTTLFALGGGVVGDMTGFAAACYMRGVAYVQVPTTSVGGKTAINHPMGKNMIGVFNQPLLVVADIETLASLPQRELVAGLAEIIKYGPIADETFMVWTECNLDALLARDPEVLAHAIKRSCEIKAQVVSQDERETGLRAILNFGHTFGHAIEAGLGFGTWLHGEAVGCGMVMAAELSLRLGLIDETRAARVARLVERAGLPIVGPDLGIARYFELMRVDKKASAGEIRFVLLEGPARAGLHTAPNDAVAGAIRRHTR